MWALAVVAFALALGLLVVIVLQLQQKKLRKQRRAAMRRRGPAEVTLDGTGGPAALEFIYGPLEGQTYAIQQEITTIGSQSGNTIVLSDPAVSRKHMGIRRDAHGYEMADLGSTNGVYVNGHRIAKKLLATGDIIRIGESEMVFQLGPTYKVG